MNTYPAPSYCTFYLSFSLRFLFSYQWQKSKFVRSLVVFEKHAVHNCMGMRSLSSDRSGNAVILKGDPTGTQSAISLAVAVAVSAQLRHPKLKAITSFKYLGSVITGEGSKPEILSRIAQTTAALSRLKPVWNDRSTSLSSKIYLMRFLVTSIFLYACESWTLTAELQRRIQAMEMMCYRKMLQI